MSDTLASLSKDQLDGLMRGLARGRYHVLLGAGASIGGTSADGRALPTAESLAEELQQTFALPEGGAKNLRRLYAAALYRNARDGRTLADFMRDRFTGTTPPSWLRHFVEIAWSHVWTLNVDDCLSRAYGLHTDTRRQQLVSISWTDRHRTPRESDSELLAIHLHGKASRAHREGELIFDISSYIGAATEKHRWHRLFGDAYNGNPFLIVGASLDDELDLQAVLDQKPMPLESPNIIVLKDIEPLQLDEYKRYGLIPVKATAEDFFAEVARLLPEYIAQLTNEEAVELSEVPAEAHRFLHQWREMLATARPPRDRRHDVFRGHEPKWTDALAGRLAVRDVQKDIAALADRRGGEKGKLLHVLAGPSFCGKTAVLYQAAKQLTEAGFRVFEFTAETALDVGATYWWMQRYPSTVLLIDDAADFAKDIASLDSRSSDTPVLPRLLAVERNRRLSHIDNVLVLTDRTEHNLSGTLSNREIYRLIDVLQDNRRAGAITGLGRAEQFDYFAKSHDRALFSAMASLERGRGFASRILDEFDSIEDKVQKNLLGLASIAARLGYGIPLDLLRSSVGVGGRELNEYLSGELGDLVSVDDGVLHLRHRFMGEILVRDRLSAQFKYETTMQLAKSLAPHVSVAAIVASTVYYRMARALMGHDLLGELFDQDYGRVLDWYQELESAFDWNARFWEQRALAAADAELFEPAYSWAREAVARRCDSLTLNTVGAVLMRRAVYEARLGEWPSETYELAETALREARTQPLANEYPYDTFFHYTLRLAERVDDIDDATKAYLDTTWSEWYASIFGVDETTRVRLHGRMEELNARWERRMST